MNYTQEQLNAMTPDQLKAVILQAQLSAATLTVASVADTTVVPVAPTDTATAVVVDTVDTSIAQIAKIKTTIETLETQGAELYADEIASLKLKITNLEAEAKEEVKVIETDADNFYDKYHSELWIISAMVILHFSGLIKI